MSDGFTVGHLVTPTGISRKVDLATDNVGQWPHLISGLCLLFCPAPRPAQTGWDSRTYITVHYRITLE